MEYKVCKNMAEAGDFYKQWTGTFNKRLVQPNMTILVARENGIKGALCVIVIDDPFWGVKWALIENVYVTPRCRAEGVGKELMSYAERYSKESDCEFMKLTTRKEDGIMLYGALGYEQGNSYYRGL